MDYLFPIAAERDWFISWIAFNLQRPETRCKVTPLCTSRWLMAPGRGWLVDPHAQTPGAVELHANQDAHALR